MESVHRPIDPSEEHGVGFTPDFSPRLDAAGGTALQAAEKPKSAVILRSSGDEESCIALKMLRARSFAQFTLSGRARFFAALRTTANGLRMTAS
jgi:hypothetical protein